MRNICVRNESQSDVVLSRFHRHPDLIFFGLNVGRQGYVLADLIQLDASAVEREFHLLVLRIAAIQSADGVPYGHPRNDVFAVRREVVMSKNAAPRSEWQTLNLFFLRIIFASVVCFSARCRFMPEGKAAYF